MKSNFTLGHYEVGGHFTIHKRFCLFFVGGRLDGCHKLTKAVGSLNPTLHLIDIFYFIMFQQTRLSPTFHKVLRPSLSYLDR